MLAQISCGQQDERVVLFHAVLAISDRSSILVAGEAALPLQRTATGMEAAAAGGGGDAAAAAGGGAVVVPVLVPAACDDMVGICSSPSAVSAPPAAATTSAAHFLCAPPATAPLAAAPSPPPLIPPRSVSACHAFMYLSAIVTAVPGFYSRFCSDQELIGRRICCLV